MKSHERTENSKFSSEEAIAKKEWIHPSAPSSESAEDAWRTVIHHEERQNDFAGTDADRQRELHEESYTPSHDDDERVALSREEAKAMRKEKREKGDPTFGQQLEERQEDALERFG